MPHYIRILAYAVKRFINLLIKELNAQECDATNVQSGNHSW